MTFAKSGGNNGLGERFADSLFTRPAKCGHCLGVPADMQVVDGPARLRVGEVLVLELLDEAGLGERRHAQVRRLPVVRQLWHTKGRHRSLRQGLIDLKRRLSSSGSNTPVIFMTAIDTEATRQEAFKAGCVAYLRKPFLAQLLIDAINNVP